MVWLAYFYSISGADKKQTVRLLTLVLVRLIICLMSNFKSIRDLLGVTQVALASGMGCSQGNVSFYEKGQTIPPDAAKRLIDFAATLGHTITFNDVYGGDSTFDADPIGQNLDTAMAETAKVGQIERKEKVRRGHDHAMRDVLNAAGKGV